MRAALSTLATVAWAAAAAAGASSSSTSSSSVSTSTGSTKTWAGATKYPTVVTRSWSRTSTVTPTSPSPDADAASEADTATATPSTTTVVVRSVTMYDQWPSSPDPANYPYTVTQTAVTHRREYAVNQAVAGGTTTRTNSLAVADTTQTVTTTWIMWDTSPTDLPVGHPLPKCEGGCAPPTIKPDKRCTDHNLDTACHSQCKIRSVEGWDVWWCQQRAGHWDHPKKAANNANASANTYADNTTAPVALGRVCTDSTGYYEQLLEPCDSADHRYDCPPCPE
ncbi:hypothetical protein SPI_07842 [Niveomyces insectorum RCEF 264]|uniref:Uncharacterized protein n=1 Tax=Niveomyces insectorum RCEF 264 TaxID=1081102 RepID=A0A167P2X1_9HYPO|nr:hypothetical protein SPI_07842 [Niveomyces insectorum RCEF 264]